MLELRPTGALADGTRPDNTRLDLLGTSLRSADGRWSRLSSRRRPNERGEGVRTQISEPTDRFPYFVPYLVGKLKALLRRMRKHLVTAVRRQWPLLSLCLPRSAAGAVRGLDLEHSSL